MNKFLLYTVIIISTILSSCTDEDTVVVFKLSGDMTIQLLDTANNPIADQTLKIYDYNYELAEAKSDADGNVKFGSLNFGDYTIIGEDVEDNGVRYNFSKHVQVVSGESKTYSITPSDYSVSLKIKAQQVIQDGINSYSDPIELKEGTIALLPKEATYTNLKDIKNKAVITATLNDSSLITIEKVPYGNYYFVVYLNEEHISNAFDIEVYSNGIFMYEDYLNISQSSSNEYYYKQLTFLGHKLYDYKEDITVKTYELLPSSYYNYTSSKLTYGKIAIMPYSSSSIKSFDELKELLIEEKAITSTGEVTFKNIPLGRYTFVVYTDEEHYTLARSSNSSSSMANFFVSNEDVTVNAYALGTALKDHTFDITFYSSDYSYKTYQYEPKTDVNIYVLKEEDYDNMLWEERSDEANYIKLATSYGTTNSEGKVSLKIPAYEQIEIICFAKDGYTKRYSKTFYSAPTSDYSIEY